MCVCLCLHVCVCESERKKAREREKARDKESEEEEGRERARERETDSATAPSGHLHAISRKSACAIASLSTWACVVALCCSCSRWIPCTPRLKAQREREGGLGKGGVGAPAVYLGSTPLGSAGGTTLNSISWRSVRACTSVELHYGAAVSLSLLVYLVMNFRRSSPPQNRQLAVYDYQSNIKLTLFVGKLTFKIN